ncbi:MAG: transcriptional regulator, AsnC family [Acidimicrobiaceae bacterium]|jgi:Lrp/AsnC family leucine-responsive transcriptional regulator|nr:transcriptional regulator, AsnC family [Acidimicrobiaceae bacterium]
MVKRQAPLSGLTDVIDHPRPSVRLDDIDRKLLALLALDARTSQRGLARELRMSPPAVGERIARLERTGVIKGYTVTLDWAAAGFPVTVYLAITAAQGSDLGKVIDGLRRVPEVSDVTVVTGSIDLLARLLVRDHAHLKELLLDRIWQIGGVQRTETFLAVAEMQPENFTNQLIRSMPAGEPAAGDSVRPSNGGTA